MGGSASILARLLRSHTPYALWRGWLIRKHKVKQEACFEEFMPEHLDTKGWLSYTDNMRSLFESQRPTDGAFRIVGAVAIDGRCSVRWQYGIYAKFA